MTSGQQTALTITVLFDGKHHRGQLNQDSDRVSLRKIEFLNAILGYRRSNQLTPSRLTFTMVITLPGHSDSTRPLSWFRVDKRILDLSFNVPDECQQVSPLGSNMTIIHMTPHSSRGRKMPSFRVDCPP
jgi:hypothetical protein